MIEAKSLVSNLVERIKADDFFQNTSVCRAYGTELKPTCSAGAVIVCGTVSADIQNAAIEQDIKAGSVTLFADIYVPWNMKNYDMQQAVARICAAAYSDNAVGVKLNEARSHKKAQCIMQRAEITYSDVFDLI